MRHRPLLQTSALNLGETQEPRCRRVVLPLAAGCRAFALCLWPPGRSHRLSA